MAGAGNPQNVQSMGRTNQGPVPAAPVGQATQTASQPGGGVYGQAAQGLTSAMGGAQAAMDYRPQQVGTQFGYNPQQVNTQFGYSPQQVSAQAASGGIGSYMNPYTSQVIDRTAADMRRQGSIQQNQIGAQASAAGAFGGSRHGVAEGTMLGETNRAIGDMSAGLRNQGFQTALGASQQDVANRLQAQGMNQGANAAAMQFGQGSRLQAQGMNQGAYNAAQQFGQSTGLQAQGMNQNAGLQGAQIGLSGAGQMGNLANMGFGFGQQIGQNQMQQGLLQQQMNQQLIDAARGQYQGFTGAPGQSLNLPLAALGAGSMGQQTQTTSRNPGLFDFLSAGLGLLG